MHNEWKQTLDAKKIIVVSIEEFCTMGQKLLIQKLECVFLEELPMQPQKMHNGTQTSDAKPCVHMKKFADGCTIRHKCLQKSCLSLLKNFAAAKHDAQWDTNSGSKRLVYLS